MKSSRRPEASTASRTGGSPRPAFPDRHSETGPRCRRTGRTLYVVDTLKGRIDAAEVSEEGRLGPSRPFVQIASEEGHPDGPTIDSEGCLWIGLYGGWEARRYSPEGELIGRVRFPVANITKLAFGGPDLRTVYATTARQFLSETERRDQTQAGHLFSFEVDVPGIACPLVAL
jgi:sugar lactone lactonase YvrE